MEGQEAHTMWLNFEVGLAWYNEQSNLLFVPEHYNETLRKETFDKNNYIINVQYFQLYLKKKMEIICINQVNRFHQKQFIKPYIAFDYAKRTQTEWQFRKEFYELMMNSVFGERDNMRTLHSAIRDK